MLSQDTPSSTGEINLRTESSAVRKVLVFLDTHLPLFPKVFKRKTAAINIEAEDNEPATMQLS